MKGRGALPAPGVERRLAGCGRLRRAGRGPPAAAVPVERGATGIITRRTILLVVLIGILREPTSRQVRVLFAEGAARWAVLGLFRDKPEQDLRCDLESGVGYEQCFEHLYFIVSHEFDAVVDIGKGAEHVNESVCGYNWFS